MQRIDNSSAATTLPVPAPAGTPGYFFGGDPQTGTEATIVDQDFMNSLQEEICNVISAAKPAITLDKTNRSQLLQALNQLFLPRILVTAPLTLYVNGATGNDANDATTPAKAVKTIQHAIDIMYWWYNFNGYGCTIQIADGTYPWSVTTGGTAVAIAGQPLGMPRGAMQLLGNPSNPDAVQITATNANAIVIWNTQLTINGVSVTATGNTWNLGMTMGMGICGQQGSWITLQNFRCKSCGMFPLRMDNSSILTFQGSNNKISGAGQYGLFAGEGGMIWCPGATLDVTGWSSTYANFMADQGRLELSSMSFIGAASCTGPRYVSTNCGVIVTGGSYPNLPGSTAGGTSLGGVIS